ncbi:MAG: hypothetical protein J6V68_01630 [Clostridia bacterium]|nr:hypothetical protein [Clostridia bacterium]
MKKFILTLLLLFTLPTLFFVACDNDCFLADYTVSVTKNIYKASNDEFDLTAEFVVTNKKCLVFTFKNQNLNQSYSIKLKNGYETNFTFNDAFSYFSANLEVDDMPKSEFCAVLSTADKSYELTFVSKLKGDFISEKVALNKLYEKQKTLIDAYTQNGIFNGKIILKATVYNDKAYWYVSLNFNDGKIKALLLDGKTAELLAVKDLY